MRADALAQRGGLFELTLEEHAIAALASRGIDPNLSITTFCGARAGFERFGDAMRQTGISMANASEAFENLATAMSFYDATANADRRALAARRNVAKALENNKKQEPKVEREDDKRTRCIELE